jgi:hypothetical protein
MKAIVLVFTRGVSISEKAVIASIPREYPRSAHIKAREEIYEVTWQRLNPPFRGVYYGLLRHTARIYDARSLI